MLYFFVAIILAIYFGIGVGSILAILIDIPWAIIDKIDEKKEIKKGTYGPDAAMYYMS